MGLVCRVAEEAGIATVCVSTGRDLTEQVKPPRSLFLNYPMGNNFGGPDDLDLQTRILRRALAMIDDVTVGGTLIDWEEAWPKECEYFRGKLISKNKAPLTTRNQPIHRLIANEVIFLNSGALDVFSRQYRSVPIHSLTTEWCIAYCTKMTLLVGKIPASRSTEPNGKKL